MASSSIEVVGGDDLKMILMQEDEEEEEEGEEQEDSDGQMDARGAASPEMNEQMDGMSKSFGGEQDFFYSPQDSGLRVKKTRNLKKKKSLLHRRPNMDSAFSDGIDYNSIGVPVSCEICGKTVANGKILIQHMSTHSELKKFVCPHCPKTFTRLVHLKGHLTVHGVEKQFQCPICMQRFSRQDCVKVHMRIHDKTKCVLCDVCNKAFLTVGALRIHQRIHSGEKPFKCHICGKCFTQKNHLITHIKRHAKIPEYRFPKKLGPRIFQCEHCPRSFIRLSDYERHVGWTHGVIEDQQMHKYPFGDDFDQLNDQESQIDDTEDFSLDIKLPHLLIPKQRNIKADSKALRTTSTQTNEQGGHIIIPRKYQTNSETKTASISTQVSAPTTPRPDHDEMYENDIFDEGMDRNFSSDEEEIVAEPVLINNTSIQNKAVESEQTKKVEMPYSSVSDEAFDAVLKKLKTEEKSPEPKPLRQFEQKAKSISQTATVASKAVKRLQHHSALPSKEKQKTLAPKFISDLNIGNWKGSSRSRGRGRGQKTTVSLTGATHLSLLRRSMVSYMSNVKQENKPKEPPNQDGLSAAEVLVEKGKRRAKSKQHGKDFICSSKSCDICNSKKAPVPPPVSKSTESPSKNVNIKKEKEEPQDERYEQSKQLLKFLVSGDTTVLQGSGFKLLNEDDEGSNTLGLLDCTETMTEPKVLEKVATVPYLGTIREPSSVISPPVVLQSFCIPSFTCHLCGREFRFEGKLHRHIESVHQKKAIFSSDVRPGRASVEKNKSGSVSAYKSHSSNTLGSIFSQYSYQRSFGKQILPPQPKQRGFPKPERRFVKIPKNPEVEALKSEWDDGEEDNEEEEEINTTLNEDHELMEEDMEEDEYEEGEEEYDDELAYSSAPIDTKAITPVTQNTTDDVYIKAVKINLNKISGVAGTRGGITDKSANASDQDGKGGSIKDPGNPLEVKCHLLLEKLFDSSLLLRCGVHSEHISVVLGKILQHYGVKMIEDYGQGQYEVLKYNLWRLIEWKVTMEQMEEFYTEGKSVEEMMDDIMLGKVPIIAHHEPEAMQQRSTAKNPPQKEEQEEQQPSTSQNVDCANQVQTLETLQIGNNHLVLSQLSNVLSGQLNLGEGITQVVLAQDVSPELLQGAHIVTIDPNTGQFLSQVSADQVILAATTTAEDEQPGECASSEEVSALPPPGSIVAGTSQALGEVISEKIDSE